MLHSLFDWLYIFLSGRFPDRSCSPEPDYVPAWPTDRDAIGWRVASKPSAMARFPRDRAAVSRDRPPAAHLLHTGIERRLTDVHGHVIEKIVNLGPLLLFRLQECLKPRTSTRKSELGIPERETSSARLVRRWQVLARVPSWTHS